MAMDNFHTTLFLSGQIWSQCHNKFAKDLRFRNGAQVHENQSLLRNAVLVQIWPILAQLFL